MKTFSTFLHLLICMFIIIGAILLPNHIARLACSTVWLTAELTPYAVVRLIPQEAQTKKQINPDLLNAASLIISFFIFCFNLYIVQK